MNRLEFDHAYPRPLPTSPRGHAMAIAFGIRFDRLPACPVSAGSAVPLPGPGEILFIGGASGSGKSALLRLLRRRARSSHHVVDLRRLPLADRPVIDLFDDEAFPATLRRLSAAGLAEVWTWLHRPRHLSEGQRWRLRLALALVRAERPDRPALLVCDEFGAILDRVSARIVAACVRRAVDERAVAAILATGHDDIAEVLAPELHLRCDFGRYQLTRMERGRR